MLKVPSQSTAKASISTSLKTSGEMRDFGSICFNQGDAVTPDLERKSDETEQVKSDETEQVKSDETEQVLIEEEKDTSDVKSGDTEELDLERIQIQFVQLKKKSKAFKDDEFLADISLNISRPRGLSIPGPMQSQPQQPTQTTDPKEKGKGILVEEPKKKKLTLQQIRALETAHDEEVARKVQAEWDTEEERKKLEDLRNRITKGIFRRNLISFPRSESNDENAFKGQGIVDFEMSAKIEESGSNLYDYRFKVIDSPVGSISGLYMSTSATSDDDFWKNQEDWEIIRWRLNESSGVHTLELEDGTMLHMLAERRYPLSRELMIRMLDHGMEVEDESETAITLIHLFILWTTEDGDDS
ncbi:hypothetical protein Tco_1054611 [Tanacetum coccineum]|uniref:Uncharacterized protein n=1 Tax=Tanacetum coccineum TaxID=301880 RepID=A0ABQ5GY72_9ASTR